jgi:hypothetical protein
MKKIVVLLLLICYFSSCVNQKAYIVNPPNFHYFKYEKEKVLKFAVNRTNVNILGNYAITDRIGFNASLFSGFNISEINNVKLNLNYFGGELSSSYYKYKSDHLYFDFQLGYGYCENNIKHWWTADPLYGMGYGLSTECEANVRYHKLFIQPGVFFIGKKKSLGLAVKVNSVYFTDYYYYYEQILEAGDNHYSLERGIRGKTAFRNKIGFVFEPVIHLKMGDVFFIQFIGAFSNNIHRSYAYEYLYAHILDPPVLHEFPNPQHAFFKIYMGFEFTLGKNKKPIKYE